MLHLSAKSPTAPYREFVKYRAEANSELRSGRRDGCPGLHGSPFLSSQPPAALHHSSEYAEEPLA